MEKNNESIYMPRIGKVVVNICVGASGEILQKAMKVLEKITGQKSCQRVAKKSVRDWGIRKKEPIACITTLREERSEDFLKKALNAVDNSIKRSSFDFFGNFSFGIKEHIEIPGQRYDPELGIFGMDICVTIEKDGYRVKRRHRLKSTIGKKQQVSREEAINFISNKFGVEIQED